MELDPTVDLIAGTVAGMGGLAVGFPLDTAKVRFQSPEIAQKYRTTFHALATIIREERVIGLYKGISSPLATYAFMNGLVFASYGFFVKIQLGSDNVMPSITQIALAGAGSGIVSSIITTPTELIKIRLQLTTSAPLSARAVALQIYRQGGIAGLYRGITATALRDCGYGAYFAAYEATCRYFTPSASLPRHSDGSSIHSDVGTTPWPALLLAGGVAGVAGWLVTFPFDVVKTRMQSNRGFTYLTSRQTERTRLLGSPANVHNPYCTMLSTITNSYRSEGIRVFFRGLMPTLIRAIPVNMATFAVFETVVQMLP